MQPALLVPLLTSQPPSTAGERSPAPPDLAAGSVIDARVISIRAIESLQARFEVLLSIGRDRQVVLASQRELMPGQRVKLEVQPGGAMTLAPPRTPVLEALRRVEQVLDQALRQRVAAQQPLVRSLQMLRSIAMDETAEVPPQVRERIAQLITALPRTAALKDPVKLLETLRQSGLFTEARMAGQVAVEGAGASPLPDTELRVALLRLAARLRSMPPQQATPDAHDQRSTTQHTLSLVSNAVTRIELLQLMSLDQQLPRNQENAANPRWFFEIPFLSGNAIESIALEVARSGEQTGKAGATGAVWEIVLTFDLGKLGTLAATARLSDRRLSLQFSSSSAQLRNLVRQHANSLRNELVRHDIDLWHVVCRDTDVTAARAPGRPLISLRT